MATLLVGVAFNGGISAELADQLVKAAEQLTYRQLCLLKLAASSNKLELRAADYRAQGTFPAPLYQVLYECHDLYQRGFVTFGGEVAFGPTDVKPAKMTPQGIGADLFNLMGLAWIPDIDLAPVIAQLQ